MRFNTRLSPFSVISFDLDDTLYHNTPVMQATDIKMIAYFKALLADKTHSYDYHFWFPFRQQALQQDAELIHDVAALRQQSYYLGMQSLGITSEQAANMAQQALEYFVKQRSNFVVPAEIHQLLAKLKKKWPLVAISNGNVDTEQIRLSQYFTEILHAGNGLKQKPAADMFTIASEKLAVPTKQFLHVGDCGRNDIYGARKAGCQTAWISSYDVGKPITVLANIELANVIDLQRLL